MDGNEWNMDAKINEHVKNKKQDNLITAEIRYKMTAKGMMITEYYGADSCVIMHLPGIWKWKRSGCRKR